MTGKYIANVHSLLSRMGGYVQSHQSGALSNAGEFKKISNGWNSIVRLYDGDMLDAGGIRTVLGKDGDIRDEAEEGFRTRVINVFIFNSYPEYDKVIAMAEGQTLRTLGQNGNMSISVNLEVGEIISHSRLPAEVRDIERLLYQAMGFEESMPYDAVQFENPSVEHIPPRIVKPAYVTYTLIAVNIAVWLLINGVALLKGLNYQNLLTVFGAKDNYRIMSGEYWRFITPVFLHANIAHLFINCYSLYAVGIITERLYGHKKFTFIYFAAGLAGNIASFIFSINPGVGASGAIFGLMGALLYYGIESPGEYRRYFGYNIILTIIVNVVYGFTAAGIDNFAHLGGLAGGFLAAGMVKVAYRREKLLGSAAAAAVAVIAVVAGLYFGFTSKQNIAYYSLSLSEDLLNSGSVQEGEKAAEEGISCQPNNKSLKLGLYENVIKAEFSQEKLGEAIEHAKVLVELSPARGHYVLGVLYYNAQQYELSKQELTEAQKLGANYSNIDGLLESIGGILGRNRL